MTHELNDTHHNSHCESYKKHELFLKNRPVIAKLIFGPMSSAFVWPQTASITVSNYDLWLQNAMADH